MKSSFKEIDVPLRVLIQLPVVLLATLVLLAAVARGSEQGTAVAVVFNSRVPESKEIASYYARKRGVPAGQVFGVDVPAAESISRHDFRTKLQVPIVEELETRGLLAFGQRPGHGTSRTNLACVASRIRYLVLCRGIPLKIQNDPALVEKGASEVQAPLRRNDAAVDSELCLLPFFHAPYPLTGPLQSPLYGVTNSAALRPENGILMTARLDGPSAEVARGLVDKALAAERDGLWGRAYFDVRGLAEGTYKKGDDWIRGAAAAARRAGFETVLDEQPATFGPGFPMSHIALYAGWYDANVSGPFARAKVEFMPGAIAYHLHSFSATTLRGTNSHWAGPLLDRGAAATMGCVEEPYLEATPDLEVFFSRLIASGFSFGEAAYASQGALSWQTTVIGDPLYRPFEKHPALQYKDLAARQSALGEWAILRSVNQNIEQGEPIEKYVEFLQKAAITGRSAVLLEKEGDLHVALKQPAHALACWNRALALELSENQRMRLQLAGAKLCEEIGRTEEAVEKYEAFAKLFPAHPDLLGIFKKLDTLAGELGKKADQERFKRESHALELKSK